MRARIVDQYIKSVLEPDANNKMYKGTGKSVKNEDWVNVVE